MFEITYRVSGGPEMKIKKAGRTKKEAIRALWRQVGSRNTEVVKAERV